MHLAIVESLRAMRIMNGVRMSSMTVIFIGWSFPDRKTSPTSDLSCHWFYLGWIVFFIYFLLKIVWSFTDRYHGEQFTIQRRLRLKANHGSCIQYYRFKQTYAAPVSCALKSHLAFRDSGMTLLSRGQRRATHGQFRQGAVEKRSAQLVHWFGSIDLIQYIVQTFVASAGLDITLKAMCHFYMWYASGGALVCKNLVNTLKWKVVHTGRDRNYTRI